MIKQIKKNTCGSWSTTNETLVNDFCKICQICRLSDLQWHFAIKDSRSQRMYVNIFIRKFRGWNIGTDIIMNFYYSL